MHGWYPPDADDRTPWGSCTATRGSRSRRCCSPSTPPSTSPARPQLGRRPAGGPPPAVPAGCARLRRDHAEGTHARDAGPRRLRVADRTHQRRPGRSRRLRRDGRGPGPDRPPSVAAHGDPLDKLTVYVPSADADRVRAALAEAGAGRIGEYEAASFSSPGEGRFRPMEGASPRSARSDSWRWWARSASRSCSIGAVAPRSIRAMLAAHPYETPAWDVVALTDAGTAATGAGRVGEVEPTTLNEFAAHVARALPQTARGVLVAGDPERAVRRVAVAGGAGDFLLDDALGADVDVFVTSDLRHHPATEFAEKGGPALVDVSHWAAEWTWLPQVGGAAGGGPGIRWRPVSARSAPTPGTSAPRGRACRDRGAHPESRPRGPAEAARPPGARRARRPAALPARDAARARRSRRARR